MTAFSKDEIALALVGCGYIIAVGTYAWWLTRSANALLRAMKEREPTELWEALGAPGSITEAVHDPHRRWRRFIRENTYRQRCHPEIIARIDAFRSGTNLGLGVLGVAGAIILYLFWPLLMGA